MPINLKKNLVVFDIESTGIHFVNDRIVELFMLKIDKNHNTTEYHQRFNPGFAMSENVISIHGITNEMVANEPLFASKAAEVMAFIGDADLGGFNSNKFDVPMLMEELGRCGIDLEVEKRKLIDAQRIFHTMEPRTLEAAYKFYCNKGLENAHSAKADTWATWEVLKAQVQKYDGIENSVEALHKFCGNENVLDLSGRIVLDNKKQASFNFGKYKGIPVKQVFKKEPSYYDWMMNGDFSSQTKKIITKLRLEMINEQ
jgi:DNA polymerase-3 subunit epsilon